MTTTTNTAAATNDLECFDHEATYCPEDNKLRIYPAYRLPTDEYQELRNAGFKWAPKQELFVAPAWTPGREDVAIKYCGSIEDEDKSPEDRAADRAERFAMYRDKRRAEAHGHADAFDAGPAVHGYQNEQRAERAARRHNRQRLNACSQWSKAEYWQSRTLAVINHALYKTSPQVRRGRILKLEAEQRKHENAYTPDPNTKPIMQDKRNGDGQELHYWCGPSRGGWWIGESVIEAAKHSETRKRWSDHYTLRLAYERQMLEAEGGTAGNVDMEPGGMIGGHLIVKVNKSNATGAVVSVNIHSPNDGQWDYRRRGDTLLINIQRFGESVYTPPTEESRAKLAEIVGKAKAKTKKRNAAAPKLINPTREAAQELQDALNREAIENCKGYCVSKPDPVEIVEMTQAKYTAFSKGTYAPLKAYWLHADGTLSDPEYRNRSESPIICKIRRATSPGNSAYRVIVITDKPQKPLPNWKQEQPEQAQELEPAPASLF